MPTHACARVPAWHTLKHTDAAFKSMRVDDGWSSSITGGGYRTTGRPFKINCGVFVCLCCVVFVCLCCLCWCVCVAFVSRLLFGCCFFFFLGHIKSPISPSTGLSRVLALLGLRPARPPYSIVPQSCGILCCCFLPYQIPYLAEYGPLACFGPTRTTASPLFNSSAELRNFVLFFAISNPLSRRVRASRVGRDFLYVKILPPNKEYGPLACFGPTRTTASPLFNSSAELRNFVLCCFFGPYQIPYLSSTGLSRVLALLGLRPASPPARPYSILLLLFIIIYYYYFVLSTSPY